VLGCEDDQLAIVILVVGRSNMGPTVYLYLDIPLDTVRRISPFSPAHSAPSYYVFKNIFSNEFPEHDAQELVSKPHNRSTLRNRGFSFLVPKRISNFCEAKELACINSRLCSPI
jgi:hypothetical protein